MKFWSIITLMCFLNFTALPGIAAVMDWEFQNDVIVNEEEPHSGPTSLIVYEKMLPKLWRSSTT
jgi:hypothetical protein